MWSNNFQNFTKKKKKKKKSNFFFQKPPKITKYFEYEIFERIKITKHSKVKLLVLRGPMNFQFFFNYLHKFQKIFEIFLCHNCHILVNTKFFSIVLQILVRRSKTCFLKVTLLLFPFDWFYMITIFSPERA